MRLSEQIIFFGIVFTVYAAVNFYILRRVVTVVPDNYRNPFIIISVFIILSYIIGRFLENYFLNHITDFLVWLGSFWIAIMFYLFLILILVDLVRLVNYVIPFFPTIIKENPEKTKRLAAIIISIFITIMVAGGFINTKLFYIKKINLNVYKDAGKLTTLNIVAASDLHLGTINGNHFAWRVVENINSLNPDIVLLAGDIVDEDIAPIIRENVGETLKLLNAKYGVYAVTGNHEYIGGINDAVNYLVDHNINLLRDSVVLIDSSFYIAGRDDLSIARFAGGKRKSLSEIVVGIDKSKPIIMMDHQPFNLNQAQENGIDLQISGHTHHGQLWPLNYITKMIYEISWGYKFIAGTHYYVSSGIGGWGPPVRLGSRPEIVNIKLNFVK